MPRASTRAAASSLSQDKSLAAKRVVLTALERLAPVPAPEWRHLASKLAPRRLARGEALTRAGEVADCFGFVRRGLVRKQYVTPAGKAIVRGFGGPGEWVGAYASLLRAEPSYLAVEAVVESELFVLPWVEMQALYARHTVWQEIGRRLAESFLLEREARAHELLTLTPRERYAAFRRSHRAILPLLKGYEIASYLGITPVSLSRIRARERVPSTTD
jgi:CRP-like cAMP-binding protein